MSLRVECRTMSQTANYKNLAAAHRSPTSMIQVYLLTPMDRATLLHAKSIITHCPPSIITRQRASVDSKLPQRPSTVGYSTYLNDNAQTSLGWFVVYILGLYKQVCNKHSDKSNRWSLSLSLWQH